MKKKWFIGIDISKLTLDVVIYDQEIRMYYRRKRDEGKGHGTVMNAVKFKIITLLSYNQFG